MSDLCKSGSESDVSSDSSWTLLNDGNETEEHKAETAGSHEVQEPKSETILTDFVNIKETKEVNSSSSDCSVSESSEQKQGCQTLNEFLTDRRIIHDYGYDEQTEYWENFVVKRNRRKRRREKDDIASAFKVMGAFLSIAGLTFACVLLPHLGPLNNIQQNKLNQPYPTTSQEVPIYDVPDVSIDVKPLDIQKELAKTVDVAKENLQEALTTTYTKHTHESLRKDNIKAKEEGPVTLKEHVKNKCILGKAKLQKQVDKIIKVSDLKRNERSLLDEFKKVGEKISEKLFPTQQNKKGQNEVPKTERSGNSSKGSFLKTNLYIALHILNDLVLLKATGHLRKELDTKLKSLKKKTQVKRCRKLLRLHKQNPDMTQISRSPFEITNEKPIEKSSNNSVNLQEKRCTKQLFKELPFVNKRIPKGTSQQCIEKGNFTKNNYFEFLNELQEIKNKKSALLKSFNNKLRKIYIKEERDCKNLDKYYFTNLYADAIKDTLLNTQLNCCLVYLHARKRDFATLLNKLDVNEIISDSPKYQQFIEKLHSLEEELVQHFKIKDKKEEDAKSNPEIGAIVDLIILRSKRQCCKDSSTQRYVVPIASNSTINSKGNVSNNLAKLQTTTTEVINCTPNEWEFGLKSKPEESCAGIKRNVTVANTVSEINSKISKEKLEVLKSWKEKYESLKSFWKSRQQYYDKRVEICEMIKDIIPPEVKKEASNTNASNVIEEQGIQILDNLIHEVISKKDVCKDEDVKETSNLIGKVCKDIKTVMKQEASGSNSTLKIHSLDMYDSFFERKGKEIMEQDSKLFGGLKYPSVEFKKFYSKHDPSKAYVPKIHKKLP